MQLFKKEFNNLFRDFGIKVNDKKKQLGNIIDFLGLELDTLQIKAWLPKDKFNKTIKKVTKIL